MSKNDDRILQLKKQIAEKKEELSKANVRFVPETNCIIELDGERLNLNVLTKNALELLMLKLNMYVMSAHSLDVPIPEISGYHIGLWISDIRKKLDCIVTKREEKELKEMEAKLDKLLSDDKKTELELDSIAALLG